MQKFQDDTADLGGSVQSGRIKSIAYTVLTAGFFAAGISYLYAPETTLQVSQEFTCSADAAALLRLNNLQQSLRVAAEESITHVLLLCCLSVAQSSM